MAPTEEPEERRALARAAQLQERRRGAAPSVAYKVVHQGALCLGRVLQETQAVAAAGLLLDRSICEAACTSDKRCNYYLWRVPQVLEEARHCATFSSCPTTEAYYGGATAVVFEKVRATPAKASGFSVHAVGAYCNIGVLENWVWDTPNAHTSQGWCEAVCASEPLCSHYLWKDHRNSFPARYHCATFATCPSWHPYVGGERAILYRKNRGQVYHDILLVDRECEGQSLDDTRGVKATGLLTGLEVCEAACANDPACWYFLWEDRGGARRMKSRRRCSLFAACRTTRARRGATVYRKRRGTRRHSGVRPVPWREAHRLATTATAYLTEAEKYSLLNGVGWDFWTLQHGYYIGNIPSVPRLGLPSLRMHDSGNGFRPSDPGIVGTVTVWPSPLALASTWDEAMVARQAAAIGRQFLGKGANVILGPALNVHRTALSGRTFEYGSGEDPYLGARLARAYVLSVQREGVMAVVKHFAFNEQETDRYDMSSMVDARTAWELYYPPFAAAIEAGAVAVMCAYNRVNWTHACENQQLLNEDLRSGLGFQGYVLSDWGATHSTALGKGLDMNQPGSLDSWYSAQSLRSAPRGAVDQAVRRILAAVYRLRLHEYADPCEPPQCVAQQRADTTSPESRMLALDAATAAVTLLKNDGILPIAPARVKTLAVVGSASVAPPAPYGSEEVNNAGVPKGDYYSGGGSGHVSAFAAATALAGIEQRAQALDIEVVASGSDDPDLAVRASQDADVVVVVAGARSVENMDRASLSLDNGADDLIQALLDAGKIVVVLMQIPGAVVMPWRDRVSAAACLFMGGEATGHAWGKVLFGEVSPEGKLPIMMPATEADVILPAGMARRDDATEAGVGRRLRGHREAVDNRTLLAGTTAWYEEAVFTSYRSPTFQAAYPFGHGLSYTLFAYEAPEVSVSESSSGEGGLEVVATGNCSAAFACAWVMIVNIGSVAGREVAQLYVEFPNVPDQPRLALRGFWKTPTLQPGERATASFALTRRDLSVYAPGPWGRWRLQESVRLHIGASSADIRHVLDLHVADHEPSN